MYLIILIFINSFSNTLQSVQAGLFCDNFLREIYLIDEESKTEKVIAQGWEGMWSTPYDFSNLNADPGALIKFRCYNYDGLTYGSGCFQLMKSAIVTCLIQISKNIVIKLLLITVR